MTKIYYFSSTGNSLWTARKVAQIIGETNPAEKCELYNIGVLAQNAKDNNSEIIIEADTVVIVFPSYAYSMPLIVRWFCRNAVFKTSYVASLVTYGSSPLGTLGSLRKILKKKKIEKMFFASIPAVENFLAMFGTPKPKKIKERTAMQERTTMEAAQAIIKRKENYVFGFYPFSLFISSLFALGVKVLYKWYRVSDKCTGCAVCEKVCPVSAIKMKDNRPSFTPKCELCQGCVNLCPLRAISFVRVKFGTEGYIHPEIKISDLMR